jgi:50S ribosomal protein L16 3-hydroxylase
VNTTVLKQLGELSVKEFMAHYWQQKPLLIRGAFPHFKAPVTIDNVLEYCLTDEAQTRLIEQSPKPQKIQAPATATKPSSRWKLTQGPLHKLPPLERAGWTVLLQGAHTASQELSNLLGSFRFIPDARLDDIMISVASDGGGVGPPR